MPSLTVTYLVAAKYMKADVSGSYRHPATLSNLVGTYNRTEKSKCCYSQQLKTLNN